MHDSPHNNTCTINLAIGHVSLIVHGPSRGSLAVFPGNSQSRYKHGMMHEQAIDYPTRKASLLCDEGKLSVSTD